MAGGGPPFKERSKMHVLLVTLPSLIAAGLYLVVGTLWLRLVHVTDPTYRSHSLLNDIAGYNGVAAAVAARLVKLTAIVGWPALMIYGRISAKFGQIDDSPEELLRARLAPIVGALSKRGSVARITEICGDEPELPRVLFFTIALACRCGEQDLQVEADRLEALLVFSGFELVEPIMPTSLGNAREVIASIDVGDLYGGAPSRKAGTPRRAIH
jgi:hypothetical protein